MVNCRLYFALLALAALSVSNASHGIDQACLQQALQKETPGQGKLSLAPGPGVLFLELVASPWGESQPATTVLQINCEDGSEQPLDIKNVFEVSDPFYDAGAQTLYFVSRDPEGGDRDIWRAGYVDGQWQKAERLQSPANSDADEFSPVMRNGRLYFASSRDGGGDLYVVDYAGASPLVSKLPGSINSPTGEWNLWINREEDMMLFEASGRDGNLSVSGDLYMTSRSAGGDWLPATHLGPLNTEGSDLNARIIGRWLIYTSGEFGSFSQLQMVSARVLTDTMRITAEPLLVVANRSSHELTFIDLASGTRGAVIRTGEGPHLLSSSPDNAYLAAVAHGVFPKPHRQPVEKNPGWQSGSGGRLSVVDTRNLQVFDMDTGCDRPHGSTWSTGRIVWVSCEDQLGLVMLNLESIPPERRLVKTGLAGLHVLAFDARRRQVLATHTDAGGLWFQPLDGSNGEFLEIGSGTEAIQLLPGDTHAAVSIGPGGQVAIINLDDRSIERSVGLDCRFPIDFAVDHEQILWVACLFSQEIVALDWASGEISRRLKIPHSPINIVAHPSKAVIYASLPRRNQVVELDLSSGAVLRNFEVGIEPDGLLLLQ